jgi:hypothetical protein
LLSHWAATWPGSEVSDLTVYGLWIVLSPVASFALTIFMLGRVRRFSRQKAAIATLGFLASVAVAFLGAVIWWQAANIACHGGYECPI